MIKYNLKCENKHEFESWFSDSNEYEKLKKKMLLECIYCSSSKISKSIMSPMVSITKNSNKKIKSNLDNKFVDEKKRLVEIRRFVEKNFDYVGENFSEKVREIYYNKKTKKAIYGTTTEKERRELLDEGIDLITIPWVNKDN
tara:strand:+ start:1343 stop:1768 length:426 start_codon:yes stop_codon:yes gene_type:complete